MGILDGRSMVQSTHQRRPPVPCPPTVRGAGAQCCYSQLWPMERLLLRSLAFLSLFLNAEDMSLAQNNNKQKGSH